MLESSEEKRKKMHTKKEAHTGIEQIVDESIDEENILGCLFRREKEYGLKRKVAIQKELRGRKTHGKESGKGRDPLQSDRYTNRQTDRYGRANPIRTPITIECCLRSVE